jgi:UDP-glucuronate 4-epimerase
MAPSLVARAISEGTPVRLFNHGRNLRDFTYVDDIVDGVVKVLLYPPAQTPQPPYRIFNLGHHRPVETILFVRMLEQLLGKTATTELLPPQPGDMLETCADLTRIQAEIGYAPKVPLETGLARFVDWYRGYYGANVGSGVQGLGSGANQ